MIAGPCVVESKELLREVVSVMKPLCAALGVPYIFKSSYRKANRTSAGSFEGIGNERALGYLAEIRAEFDVPTLTDIHAAHEAARAAEFGIDVLQIPAFLSRQTDIIHAAADTGKIVNIKKGQFLAPDDMQKAAAKAIERQYNAPRPVWLTERGTSFGYHDLIVDMRSIAAMKASSASSEAPSNASSSTPSLPQHNYRIIYDATHSVQQPSKGTQSGGQRQYIAPLARAAVAVGIDGLFFEVHPCPAKALSDAATQLPLSEVEHFLSSLLAIHSTLRPASFSAIHNAESSVLYHEP